MKVRVTFECDYDELFDTYEYEEYEEFEDDEDDIEYDEDGVAWWFDAEEEIWYFFDEDEDDWFEWDETEYYDFEDEEVAALSKEASASFFFFFAWYSASCNFLWQFAQRTIQRSSISFNAPL